MRITRVQATSHRVPAKVPWLDDPILRDVVFVRIETDENVAGYGLTGQIQRFAVRELINREMAPLLLGENPLCTERHWQSLFLKLNPRAQTGAWSSAMSAVDIALWDIKGKYLNQPVWRLLGGAQGTVQAYITFGLLEYSHEQLTQVARMYVDQGHTRLKMVVGIHDASDPKEDAARVRTVREAVGSGVELMIDANYLFSFPRALELCRRVESLDITWFEEPVYGNDALLLADLRRQTTIPISAGQNEGFKWRHRELLTSGAIDIVQPNVVYVGGYTEAMKVAAMAQAYNLPIANGGGWPHHNLPFLAAIPNGWRVEYHVPMWVTGDFLYQDPPGPVNGEVTLSDAPGLGLDPREDALETTREE